MASSDAPPSKKPRLTYLDIKCLAEPIRLALFIGGVDFEDCRVDYEGIKALQEAGRLPFAQVPMLELDGRYYAQSQALLRWAGKKAGLYPEDLQLQCDCIEEALVDMKRVLGPQWYGVAMGRDPVTKEKLVPLTEEQRAEVQRVLNERILPPRFAELERSLSASGGPHFCGEQMTICDLSFYVYASGILDGTFVAGVSPSVLDGCPLLKALVRRIAKHPKVHEWEAQHG
mmetsp:Transcript_61674/g.123632  ORF Transcript_61674/g.123632 Transcript_61674/m.123632 type:complete len:229 (+) Transcript_61674:2-688(+)